MIEQVYQLTQTTEKTIEKVLGDERMHYMHMVLPKGEGLPEHTTNSNVYMTVVKGTLNICLEEESEQIYEQGTLLTIPFGIKMNAYNVQDETLELIVVKVPAPGN